MRRILYCGIALLVVLAQWVGAQDVISKDVPFLTRYAVLEAARKVYNETKNKADKQKALDVVASALEIFDMADLAVEDIRKWKRWEFGEAILKLPAKAGFGKSIILRQCVLRFALQCPTKNAKDYVEAQRRLDREFVQDIEDSLRQELESTKSGSPEKR